MIHATRLFNDRSPHRVLMTTGDVQKKFDQEVLGLCYLNYAQIRRSHRRWSCGGRGSRVDAVI